MRALILLLLVVPAALALECGDMTESAVLDENLVCDSDGLIVNGTLDCAGHVIAGSRNGIGITLMDNGYVANCNITRFHTGVLVLNGSVNSSILEDNTEGVRLSGIGSVTYTDILQNKYGVYLEKGASAVLAPNAFRNNDQDVYEEPDSEEITLQIGEPHETKPPATVLQQDLRLSPKAFVEELAKKEYSLDEVPIPTLNNRIARLRRAAENIDIRREFVEKKGSTTVIITLRPKNGFFSRLEAQNFEFYEKIPKCFGLLVDVVFDQEPTIIEEDIVYKRSLEKMRHDVEFRYKSARVVDEKCKDLFSAVGLTESVERLSVGRIVREDGLGAFFTTFWSELWKLGLTLVVVLFVISIILRRMRLQRDSMF